MGNCSLNVVEEICRPYGIFFMEKASMRGCIFLISFLGHNLLAEQSLNGNGANPDSLLPIPGHPGGPPVPDFGRTNDAITAMNEVSMEGDYIYVAFP